MNVDSNEVATILEDAAELISKTGWTQGSMTIKDYSDCFAPVTIGYCSVGALRAVAKDKGTCLAAAKTLAESLHLRLSFVPPKVMQADGSLRREAPADAAIMSWNDRTCKSKDQVLDALVGAAKELRNG